LETLFFLHVTTRPDSTNNVLAVAFGVLIVFLVVAGSLWIVADLNAMMPAAALMHIISEQRRRPTPLLADRVELHHRVIRSSQLARAGRVHGALQYEVEMFKMSLRNLVETGNGKSSPRDVKIDNWNEPGGLQGKVRRGG
jgi:hypothetical protein